ncbi:hypothetical protein QCM80_23725 [Bradyrhizobium sp. SSUT112]|uniref:hypothetical protein n=1 Tax=Bradyrhizobium sp. SSUT112 TaxID=3040604 RepID=UPI002447CE2D|nr:hypothetical protein [Bradyrhizobium sp. SSUT112]MDH2353645.1 hypothetical protein [Bradyrhizobium sp. SSUT112]
MSESERDFEKFLRAWCDDNLGSFGDHVDPSDLQFFHGRRAERLKVAAEVAGFAPQITMLSRSEMGGLGGFIQRQYEGAEFRRRHGDI